METYRIGSMQEAMDVLFADSFDSDISRTRSSFVFRGMCNSDYKLISSFRRNCRNKLTLEKAILRNFSKYAVLDEPDLTSSVWRQLILGQHHGLPTRLLDWSYSPLVALHFATDDNSFDKLDMSDAVVWMVSLPEINDMLPHPYQNEIQQNGSYILTVEMLENIVQSLDQYDKDMKDVSFAFLEPPSIDSRIINQYSLFSIMPSDIVELDGFLATKAIKTRKVIIDKAAKWSIRDMLDQMNMNERIIYPGLDGLASWLKRHYYVRDRAR